MFFSFKDYKGENVNVPRKFNLGYQQYRGDTMPNSTESKTKVDDLYSYKRALEKTMPWIIENMVKSQDKTIRISESEIRNVLGPEFKDKSFTDIYMGTKYVLQDIGIIVESDISTKEYSLVLKFSKQLLRLPKPEQFAPPDIISEEEISKEISMKISWSLREGLVLAHKSGEEIFKKVGTFRVYFFGLSSGIQIYSRIYKTDPQSIGLISIIEEILSNENLSDIDIWNELLRLLHYTTYGKELLHFPVTYEEEEEFR